MAKLNRICIICHKKYSYCPSCAVDANKPTWLSIFCSENCRNLYNTINDYRYKLLSKEDAFDKLIALDLSCINELPKDFNQIIDEILKKEIVEEKKVEENATEEKVTEEEKPTKIRKRNYSKKENTINNLIDSE